ncbi:reductase [Streptomyces albus]|uniref:Reductase n=1 Tax=Streptomyces albus (strain ATCC 21838 / DSM 41398 / FERM P-419 / JCM 4703 / NBRC 107858) TaxID=1081613 RepID=A0A0B5F577_STRA4|nr:reductase [Streptomyces albus]AOU80338.1 reductase [Streptomyces albus]AYN36049.1 reductase [Streptomyces albus]
MRLLILGGTQFAGRALAEAALARSWEVTVFHRGRHEAPAGVRVLHGDRTAPGGLDALADGAWDVAVDTWSAAPAAVDTAARALAGRVGRYVYVSSCSVYAWPPPAGFTEDAAVVAAAPDAESTDYAADKRGGELAALAAFGTGASLLVRAGLILGPYENIGRLPYWLNRIASGGRVLAPGPRGLPVQYIDVRDLAEWILDAAERGLSGPYNLVGPQGHATIGELLDHCLRVTGSAAELRWTDPGTVLAAGIEPWTQLPVWAPPDSEIYDALFRVDVSAALAAGLRVRPVAETVADTWRWLCAVGGEAPVRPDRPPVGLDPDVEREVLGQ